MAQGYERKDNRPKMCFKGDWTKDHHVEDSLLTFVLLSSCSIFGAPFSAGILSLFFFACFASILLCAFLVFAPFHFQQGEFITFLLSTRNRTRIQKDKSHE